MIARRRAGSAMLIALLLLAVAGVITAAWLTLMTARSGLVGEMAAAVQRRIALENSRALAQEFLLERVIASSSGVAFSYDLPDPAWGGIRVPAWNAAPLLSVQKAAGVNAFNPGNGDGYTLDLAVTLVDGDANPSRRFSVKSRSPLLAGRVLVSQAPTLTPGAAVAIGALTVGPAAFIWSPNLAMAFVPASFALPEGAATLAFGGVLMNDLAQPRQVANPRLGGAPIFDGQFDTIDNAAPAANSLVAKTAGGTLVSGSSPLAVNGVSCDGAGNVTITLNTAGLGNILIAGEVTALTLAGQAGVNNAAADDLPALLIVLDQPLSSTRDLTTLTLSGHNRRRVVLAVKKAGGAGTLPLQFTTAGADWRLLLELENTPVSLTASGSALLRGGIRSDRTIALGGGAVRIAAETDPKLLERLASRNAWVESNVP